MNEVFAELEKGLNKVYGKFEDIDFDEDAMSEILRNKV